MGEDWQYAGHTAWDDVSGMKLDPERLRETIREYIEEYHKHDVSANVPIEEYWRDTCRAPVGVIWIDINKGDTEHQSTDPGSSPMTSIKMTGALRSQLLLRWRHSIC